MTDDGHAREAQRQQALLQALWRAAPPQALEAWMAAGTDVRSGTAAYRANAGAHAERALAVAFPTVRQLLGDESFAARARAHRQADAPQRGDLAQWGAGLPAVIAVDAQLSSEPYLADVARLDWAVFEAEQAANPAAATGLLQLGRMEPDRLCMRLQSGTALVASAWPVATIWRAHRSDAPDALAPARVALAARRAETALVRRDGWRATVRELPPSEARFTAALLRGEPLASALDEAGPDFAFEPWLIAALRDGAVAAVEPLP